MKGYPLNWTIYSLALISPETCFSLKKLLLTIMHTELFNFDLAGKLKSRSLNKLIHKKLICSSRFYLALKKTK